MTIWFRIYVAFMALMLALIAILEIALTHQVFVLHPIYREQERLMLKASTVEEINRIDANWKCWLKHDEILFWLPPYPKPCQK